MKKIVIIFILIGAIGICMPAMANNIKFQSTKSIQHPDTVKRKIVKKRRTVAKRHTSTRQGSRINMQLRQANKHLKDEKRADSAHNAVKKELHP